MDSDDIKESGYNDKFISSTCFLGEVAYAEQFGELIEQVKGKSKEEQVFFHAFLQRMLQSKTGYGNILFTTEDTEEDEV